MRGGLLVGPVEFGRGDAEQGVVDQGRLAGARHAGDRDEQPGGDLEVDVLEVVAGAAEHAKHALGIRFPALLRHFDAALAGQELAGDRVLSPHHVGHRALRHHAPAVDAGTGADVDHVVGGADRVLVVLDHDHRIAEVAQPQQGAEQPLVVALVQADAGLVEHIHHADQAGADLAGKPDALRLAAGQGVGLALQVEIVQAHVGEKAQALADFLDDLGRDLAAPAIERERLEEGQRAVDRQHGEVMDAAPGDEHVARAAVQALAAAIGAGPVGDELRQFLPHHRRFGLAVAALEVVHDALEAVLARMGAGVGGVAEGDLLLAAAVQHGLLHLGRQRFPRRVDVEPVVFGQRDDHAEVVDVAPVPAAHGARGQRQFRVHHDALRVEELGHAEAVAGRAGADRRVEREQSRLQFRQRVVADRAGIARGEQHRGGLGIVHVGHDGEPLAEAQRGLERLREALLDVGLGLEAVDHRFDGVLDPQAQRRHGVDVVQCAVDPHPHETLLAQVVEHLHMFALALAHHRGEQHPAPVGVQRQRRVDHLRDGLRLQGISMVGAARRAHAREQQSEVVVDLGDRADRRTRVVRGRLLLDRDRGREALDVVEIGLFHHREELPRVGAERFHVAALALGVDGVEGQRGLARPRQAGDHDQPVARQVEVDVLQVVRARAAQADEVHGMRRRGEGKGGIIVGAGGWGVSAGVGGVAGWWQKEGPSAQGPGPRDAGNALIRIASYSG